MNVLRADTSPVGDPTEYVGLLRRAAAGDAGALSLFVAWAYGRVRRMLDRPSRRTTDGSPATEAEDEVQTAMMHVVGGLHRCRAENDYQLAAWLDQVAWRGVLRERVEQRSLDAVPRGAGAVRRLPPGAVTAVEDPEPAVGVGTGETAGAGADGPGPRADDALRLWRALAAALPALPPEGADAGHAAPAGPGADPDTGPGAASRADTAPLADALGRVHAREVHALLCRLAVRRYAALPSDTQAMWWERLVRGAPWAAVAASAGLTEAAAKRRIERAGRTLARQIADDLGALPPLVGAVVRAHCRRLGIALPGPAPTCDADARPDVDAPRTA